jgi:hypothetical protein
MHEHFPPHDRDDDQDKHDEDNDNRHHLPWSQEDSAKGQSPRGPTDENRDNSGRHLENSTDMAMEFCAQLGSCVQHFFVTLDAGDPEATEEIGGLDPAIDEPASITRFLTLPTVTRQRHSKIRDPIFYFAQSKVLTSKEYNTAVDEMRLAKEVAE